MRDADDPGATSADEAGPERERGEADRAHMRRALSLATQGWGQTAPNPMVGAVVVRDGRVVGEGWHARFGDAHAEVAALAEAGESARGATVYVTLEPCAHHGKTPPCVDALVAAGVTRVVVGARDPNPVARGGVERLRAAGIDVDVGVEAAAARELDAPFFFAHGAERPWVTLKLAVSIDGAVADHTRRPGWITGEASRREVHRLRAGHDAVAVGAATVRFDDPALTVRDAPAPRVPPVRVVFAAGQLIDAASRLARTAREVPTVVVAPVADGHLADELRALGVELVEAATLAEGLRALRARGVRSLLVEGGARLASALWDASLVDRLIIFQGPVVLGGGALHAFAHASPVEVARAPRLRVLARRELGDDVATTYAVSPTPEVR